VSRKPSKKLLLLKAVIGEICLIALLKSIEAKVDIGIDSLNSHEIIQTKQLTLFTA
jgi:hypothetical protein